MSISDWRSPKQSTRASKRKEKVAVGDEQVRYITGVLNAIFPGPRTEAMTCSCIVFDKILLPPHGS